MVKHSQNIGLIGYGKMGSAIISGSISSGKFSENDFMVYTPSEKSQQTLSVNHENVAILTNAHELVSKNDIIILCAKPNMYKSILDSIKNELNGKLLVSIAAGLTSEYISSIVGDNVRIIRTMPNIAAQVSASCTIISSDHCLSKHEYSIIENLFSSIGSIVSLPERLIDPASAIAGSGPAFISIFLEALVDAGVYLGIDRVSSDLLAKGMLNGCAQYLSTDEYSISDLKTNVCSPAGSSIRGVKTLHDEKVPAAIINAVINTSNRCLEISNEEKKEK